MQQNMIYIMENKYFLLENICKSSLTAFALTSSFIYIRKKFNCRESSGSVMQMRRYPVLINELFNTFVKIHGT